MKTVRRIQAGGMAGGLLLALMMTLGGGVARAATDWLSTPSEEGSPSFHPHLVKPGGLTTFLLQVQNPSPGAETVKLDLASPAPAGWSATLADPEISLSPGEHRQVLLTLKPAAALAAGSVVKVTVKARAGSSEESCTVAAKTSNHRKIFFISIDSLHPDYLKLNALGTGPGREGDWLMPNLHRLMQSSVFYPNAQVHIIAATDMNHYNFVAGTNTGTSGVALVGGFFFGFDDQGRPIVRSAAALESSIIRYGRDGKHVESLFNGVKRLDPDAWTAFVSGKNWVPELYRFPEFQIDRIIHGSRVPEFIPAPWETDLTQKQFLRRAIHAVLPGSLPAYAHELANPAGLSEPQDKREQFKLARLMSSYPQNFPPDAWIMDAALAEIQNEDPDVTYILLAAVDDVGHALGAAHDPAEWDEQGTPQDLRDDVSKYDPRASRQGVLNVVREADRQVGRFLDTLEPRGLLENSIIVLESDHNMVTHYRRALDTEQYLKKHSPLSLKTDYFFGGATSLGMVMVRRDDPAIAPQVEKSLEAWQVKNPLTGQSECPVVVYNREEMKTGMDAATGKAWMLPKEYYSEYYIEHRQPGEQVWADLLVLTAPHYKFKIQGFGLGNLGVAKLPFKLPEWGYFIGGHGSFETRGCLLIVHVPGLAAGENPAGVYAMDVAPTLERLQGWPVPPSTDGKGLPGIDPGR